MSLFLSDRGSEIGDTLRRQFEQYITNLNDYLHRIPYFEGIVIRLVDGVRWDIFDNQSTLAVVVEAVVSYQPIVWSVLDPAARPTSWPTIYRPTSFFINYHFRLPYYGNREELYQEAQRELGRETLNHFVNILVQNYGFDEGRVEHELARFPHYTPADNISYNFAAIGFYQTFTNIAGCIDALCNPIQAFDTDKAKALLLDSLTDEQKATWLAHKWFEVIGGESGATYRILEGTQINIRKRTAKGWERLCVVPDTPLPLSDVVLSQKYMIEHDEGGFNAVVQTWGIDSKISD